MLPLTVLGIGLALAGIGVSLGGALSTGFISAGIVISLLAGWLYLRGHHGGTPSTTLADGGSGHGHVRGNVISGSTINVAPKPGPAEPSDDRVFVDQPPQNLVALIERGSTHAEGQRLIKPYLGNWIRLSGEVDDVFDHLGKGSDGLRLAVPPVTEDEKPLFVYVNFEEDWADRVSLLQRGAKITVIGQIRTIEFGVGDPPYFSVSNGELEAGES